MSFNETNKNKYYKLIKDLPTFEAGDVFKINWSGHLESIRNGERKKVNVIGL